MRLSFLTQRTLHRGLVAATDGQGDDEQEEPPLASGIKQLYSTTTIAMQLSALEELLLRLSALSATSNAPRLVVFCQTIRLAQFYAEYFSSAGRAISL